MKPLLLEISYQPILQGGAITITLPITPSINQLISVHDFGGNAAIENITIGRNGETIDGLAEDFIIDENYGRVDLIYDGSGWKISIVTPGAGLTEAQVDLRIEEDRTNTLSMATGDEIGWDFDLTVDKSTSGNFTGLKLNVTETDVPGTNNRLLDLSVDGNSKTYFDNMGALVLPGGAVSAPALRFGDPDTGIYATVSGRIMHFAADGVSKMSIDGNGVSIGSSQITGLSPTSASVILFRPFASDGDTGIARPGANDQLSITCGGVEVLRCVEDTGNAAMLATGQTVAGLPVSPSVGMFARVTDADGPSVGSTVVGGGTDAALVWYNGTNWNVIGI